MPCSELVCSVLNAEDTSAGSSISSVVCASNVSALVSGVQNKIKSKVFDKMGTGASAALDSQSRQLDMVRAQTFGMMVVSTSCVS